MKSLIPFILILMPLLTFSQEGSLANCHWLNSETQPGETQVYQVTWSALGTGNQDAKVVFQSPAGTTTDGWLFDTAEVSSTNMTGTWEKTKITFGGNVEFVYTDVINDGDWAIFEISATHDGVSEFLDSRATNVVPGPSECQNAIPMAALTPVELSQFDAVADHLSANLIWETETEENSSHFEIETSANGVDFERIAIVYSKSDMDGNSDSKLNYQYIDKGAATRGVSVYYRLKQIDRNSDFAYSEVRLVEFRDVVIESKAFPNPVHQGESVVVQGNDIQHVQLFDAKGQTVLSNKYDGVRSTSIATDTLSPGLYYILLDGKEKISIVVR